MTWKRENNKYAKVLACTSLCWTTNCTVQHIQRNLVPSSHQEGAWPQLTWVRYQMAQSTAEQNNIYTSTNHKLRKRNHPQTKTSMTFPNTLLSSHQTCWNNSGSHGTAIKKVKQANQTNYVDQFFADLCWSGQLITALGSGRKKAEFWPFLFQQVHVYVRGSSQKLRSGRCHRCVEWVPNLVCCACVPWMSIHLCTEADRVWAMLCE